MDGILKFRVVNADTRFYHRHVKENYKINAKAFFSNNIMGEFSLVTMYIFINCFIILVKYQDIYDTLSIQE